MTVEQQLEDLIRKTYPSVRVFYQAAGLSEAAVERLVAQGLADMKESERQQICSALDLDADALVEGRMEKRTVRPDAAAAHFDLNKMTPAGIGRYKDYVQSLSERLSKQ